MSVIINYIYETAEEACETLTNLPNILINNLPLIRIGGMIISCGGFIKMFIYLMHSEKLEDIIRYTSLYALIGILFTSIDNVITCLALHFRICTCGMIHSPRQNETDSDEDSEHEA